MPIDKGVIVPEYHIRHNSATEKATYLEIEELYKYRFRIDEHYWTKFIRYLNDIDDWTSSHSMHDLQLYGYYTKNTDFQLITKRIDLRNENKDHFIYVGFRFRNTVISESIMCVRYPKGHAVLIPVSLSNYQRNSIYYNLCIILNHSNGIWIKNKFSLEQKKQDFERICKENNIIWQ